MNNIKSDLVAARPLSSVTQKCTHKTIPAREPHICPQTEAVFDDSETRCTCCDDCEAECSYEI